MLGVSPSSQPTCALTWTKGSVNLHRQSNLGRRMHFTNSQSTSLLESWRNWKDSTLNLEGGDVGLKVTKEQIHLF